MRTVKINGLFKNITLEVISYLVPHKQPNSRGRPQKCTNEECLDKIFYVLKEGIGWEYIEGFKITGDALRKIFKKWTELNVFRYSWIILLDIYKEYKIDFDDIFIDTSHIKNYMGSESTGPNHYDRFRKGTKLSVITDDVGVPIGIHLDKSNTHDIKLVNSTIEKMDIPIESTQFLVGDKGYQSKDLKTELANKYKLELIAPRKRKKNQIGQIRGRKPKNYHKLKGRFIIEHTFSWFKNYARLYRRKDKKINTFESFIFMGAANIIAKKIENIFN